MEAIVGLADNDQTTPFAVIVPQVVLMVFPPLLALVEVMAVAVTVVTAGVPLIPLPVTAVVMPVSYTHLDVYKRQIIY